MTRVLFSALLLGALGYAAPAIAADLPIYNKAKPAAVVPTYDWSGF